MCYPFSNVVFGVVAAKYLDFAHRSNRSNNSSFVSRLSLVEIRVVMNNPGRETRIIVTKKLDGVCIYKTMNEDVPFEWKCTGFEHVIENL